MTRRIDLSALLADRRFARGLAIVLAAVALLAAVIHLGREPVPGTGMLPSIPAAADPLRAELARCGRITDPAAVDAACRAAWAESRRRFLNLPEDRPGGFDVPTRPSTARSNDKAPANSSDKPPVRPRGE